MRLDSVSFNIWTAFHYFARLFQLQGHLYMFYFSILQLESLEHTYISNGTFWNVLQNCIYARHSVPVLQYVCIMVWAAPNRRSKQAEGCTRFSGVQPCRDSEQNILLIKVITCVLEMMYPLLFFEKQAVPLLNSIFFFNKCTTFSDSWRALIRHSSFELPTFFRPSSIA